MSIATYAELQTAIASWLNRDDMEDTVPALIRLAEAKFRREIRFRAMLTRDITTADEEYENLPADFLELKHIRFNTVPAVVPEYVTPSFIGALRASNVGASAPPRFYTILGNQLLFDRTPVGEPELDILSYVALTPLSDENEGNALLEQAPDIYLYGSLTEAEAFLKNDERVGLWKSLYEQAKAHLHAADEKAEASPSPLIMRPKRSF
jgi:hypothetical protein